MSVYTTMRTVRFSHCDPAGIIYFPRYFDLIHEAKEDWFRYALKYPFAQMFGERRNGFPIAHVEADFTGPSRLGEDLTIALTIEKIGASALHLHYAVACAGEPRMEARTVIVHVELDTGRPVRIDDDLRERLERFRDGLG